LKSRPASLRDTANTLCPERWIFDHPNWITEEISAQKDALIRIEAYCVRTGFRKTGCDIHKIKHPGTSRSV
jgi:hypothetical protein